MIFFLVTCIILVHRNICRMNEWMNLCGSFASPRSQSLQTCSVFCLRDPPFPSSLMTRRLCGRTSFFWEEASPWSSSQFSEEVLFIWNWELHPGNTQQTTQYWDMWMLSGGLQWRGLAGDMQAGEIPILEEQGILNEKCHSKGSISLSRFLI